MLLPSFILSLNLMAQAQFADLDQHFAQLAQRGEFSGVIQIQDKGTIQFFKAYGLADHEQKTPLTTRHYFDIGSMTKQFTAAAILRLHEQGHLSLFDPLGKYFKLPTDRSGIRILHLITHRSGLGDPDSADTGWQEKLIDEMLQHEENPIEFFRIFLAQSPQTAAPGARWDYNNLAYALLAHLVDRTAGMSFEDYVRQEFFTPFHIDCGFEDGKSIPEALRTYGNYEGRNSYLRAGDLLPGLALRGSTSIVCSSAGIATWEKALLDQLIFPRHQAQYFFLEGMADEFKTTGPFGYSFGWFIDSPTQVSHSGANGGYESLVHLDLEEKVSVIVLTNLANPDWSNVERPWQTYLNQRPRGKRPPSIPRY